MDMNASKVIPTEVVGQRKIFSNYAFLFLRTFLLSGISFGSAVFIYRILSVKEVGLAAIYMAVLNSIMGLVLGWPVTGFRQYGREEYDRSRELKETFGSTLFLIGMLFLISLAVCILIRRPLMRYIGLPTEWIWLLLLNLFFIMVNKMLNQVFYITASIPLISLLDLLEPLCMFLFVLYIWFTIGSLIVTTYLSVYVCLSAVTFFSYLFFLREHLFPFKWSFPEAKRILRFSGFLYGGAIFTFIYDQFDYLIINHYRPAEQLAYYSLAYRIYTFVTMLPMLSVNLIYPIMISYRNLGRVDLFQRYSSRNITQMLFFWTVGCMTFLLFSPFLIPLLFGTVYESSIPSLSLFCLAAIFQFTIACHSPILISHERVDWSMKVGLTGTIIIAIGNLLLIPSMGILGAALSTLISYGFNSIAYSYLTSLLLKIRYKGYELFMALFCFPMVMVTLLQLSFVVRVLIFGMEIAVMLWWSYRSSVFHTADLFFLDQMSMPGFVRKIIYTIFTRLESPQRMLKGMGA